MNLNHLRDEALAKIVKAENAQSLEKIRVEYLGRQKGVLTDALKSLKDLSVDEKRTIGPQANAAKKDIEKALNVRLSELKKQKNSSVEKIDITMPGTKLPKGHLHPLTLLKQQIFDIFLGLNFSIVEGPEIEPEYYSFDALNIPEGHPAKGMWDTIWLNKNESKPDTQSKHGRLHLRPHTSPMQIRYMEMHQPPFQIIVPGRVFRYEATDATHQFNFYQIEGLMVGSDITLANFKFIVEKFVHELFGKKTDIRFRPSYFPFVEPGVEVDIKFRGKWMEVMGAGMVHPGVFKKVGYNPKNVQGFAFGFGLDRFAMIKYKINDIRLFYGSDLRFINQF